MQVNDLDEIHPVISINGEEIIFHPTENPFPIPVRFGLMMWMARGILLRLDLLTLSCRELMN